MKKIRVFILFFLILISTSCHKEKDIAAGGDKIKNFNISEKKTIDEIKKHPNEYCKLLMDELQVIEVDYIDGYEKDKEKYKNAIHVIDCLRMLRMLSGKKFYGSSKYNFEISDTSSEYDLQRLRYGFLHADKKSKMPFFSVWMSRDSIFIAPPDAQKEMIQQWKEWYKKIRGKIDMPENTNVDFWYF